MKYHLSNGCSFSTRKKFDSCHQRLGQLLNTETPTISMAKGGRGNDRIVNTTMHWFFKNPDKMKDTFVSVGWTVEHRNTHNQHGQGRQRQRQNSQHNHALVF